MLYLEKTTEEQRSRYDKLLVMMGALSNLFSDNEKPFLHYRVTENLFCRCLDAKNLSRSDVTADAKKDNIGIGIKTWIDSNIQKIAEFDKLRSEYAGKNDEEMIKIVATFRNERIEFTKRTYDLESMIYHCLIREKGAIKIAECPLDPIDIDRIHNISRRGKNTILFTDGHNNYQFSTSKSTLYKNFSDISIVKTLPVKILDDPYSLLENKLMGEIERLERVIAPENRFEDVVYLPLYSVQNGQKIVMPKSGLNLRLAGGRARNPYEVYIRVPAEFNRLYRNFFPPSDQPFDLTLPDGKVLSVKICQENDKALLSNPNEALGHWLIDDVFKISPDKPITYEMLEKFGIDSVKFTKDKTTNKYSIDFAKTDSYENFMGRDVNAELTESED